MKNYITLLLVLVIVFCQPMSVFAEINNQNTSNRHERIIQEDFINQQIILNDTSKLEKEIQEKPYSVSDDTLIFKSIECLDDNSKTKLYKQESIFIVAQKDQLKKLIECVDILNDKIEYHNEYAINPTEIMLLEDHNYRETIDSTSSVSGYITVYFSVSTKGGNDYYKITNVTGGYVKHDRSVSVQGQSLTVSQKGRTYSNGTKNQQTTVAKGASSSWSYTPSSSWYAVNGDVAGTMVGAYCVFSLRRGTGNNASAWNFTTNCPVVTNVIG